MKTIFFRNSFKAAIGAIIAISTVSVACVSCAPKASQTDSCWWGQEEAWYDNGQGINPDYVDVFYLYSTDVESSVDAEGNVSYTAALTEEDRKAIDYELHSSNTKIFPDSLNFIAPYYHQYTFESLSLPESKRQDVRDEVVGEVLGAFRHYMRKVNGGRRFILAGFSQGGEMALEILKHLTDEEYSRMVAAYLIGYKVTAADMGCGHIVPATDPYSNGVTVSFNSIATRDAFFPMVNADAAFCTNPINWASDGTPAEFEYEGETLTVQVDTGINSLIVGGTDMSKFRYEPLERFCKPGNLHHWDIKFYRPYLRKNVLERAYPKDGQK